MLKCSKTILPTITFMTVAAICTDVELNVMNFVREFVCVATVELYSVYSMYNIMSFALCIKESVCIYCTTEHAIAVHLGK